MPQDDEVINWVLNAPKKGFDYIVINEATNACEKKSTEELKESCRKKILKK